MANKLVDRYNEIEVKIKNLRQIGADRAEGELVQEKIRELEAKRADLKTALHLVALSSIRDAAWRTLSY